MLTPLHLAGLILWAPIERAQHYRPFIMWTEQYAPYCPIEYGALYE